MTRRNGQFVDHAARARTLERARHHSKNNPRVARERALTAGGKRGSGSVSSGPAVQLWSFTYEKLGGDSVEGIRFNILDPRPEVIILPNAPWDLGWDMQRLRGSSQSTLPIQSIQRDPDGKGLYFNISDSILDVGDRVLISRALPFPSVAGTSTFVMEAVP